MIYQMRNGHVPLKTASATDDTEPSVLCGERLRVPLWVIWGQPIQVMSKIRMISAVSSAWKLSSPYPEPKTVMR